MRIIATIAIIATAVSAIKKPNLEDFWEVYEGTLSQVDSSSWAKEGALPKQGNA